MYRREQVKTKDELFLNTGAVFTVYVLLFSIANVLVTLFVSGTSETYLVIVFLSTTSSMSFIYSYAPTIKIDFNKISKKTNIYRMIAVAINILLFTAYVAQGMPPLIEYRTNNQHAVGFIWTAATTIIMLTPLLNKKRSIAWTIFFLVGVILSASRLNLLIFVLLNCWIFRIPLLSTKGAIIVILFIIMSSGLAVIREGGRLSDDTLLFYVNEAMARNVALSNGISILKTNCSQTHIIPNPFVLLIPRIIYPEKPLVYNVRAFMCYYGKKHPPSKTSGFYLSELIGYAGPVVGSAAIFLIGIAYAVSLVLALKAIRPVHRLFFMPIAVNSLFGPIDGLYSSSFQLGLIIVLFGIFYYAVTCATKTVVSSQSRNSGAFL